MYSTILPSVMGKNVGQTELFNHGMTTSIGDAKL